MLRADSRLLPRHLVVCGTLAFAAACGIFGPRGDKVCTLIGCDSGLTVHLNAKPAGTYRVEVFAHAPDQQPAYVYECTTAASCQQDIFFTDLIVDHPFIRITTKTGTKLVEFPTVTYVDSYPNGRDCGPPCRNARLNMDIPATAESRES
jgi:hypothetical protein